MLLGNYSVLHKLPLRFFGGSLASVEVGVRSNYGKSGANRNRFYKDMETTALSLMAVPSGTYIGSSWIVPQEAGDMSAIYSAFGSGLLSGGLAAGFNIIGESDGVSTATATGTLIVWAVGQAGGSCSSTSVLVALGVMSGQTTGNTTTQANINALAAGAGEADGHSSVSGTLSSNVGNISGDASGQLNGTSSAYGTIKGIVDMMAAAGGLSFLQADVSAIGNMSGSVSPGNGQGTLSGDPWTTDLTGTFPVGSAGEILAGLAKDTADAVWEYTR